MTTFTIHTPETAPEAARQTLRATQANWKFIPNLHGILAEAPVALEAYNTLFGLVGKTSFDAVEQQVLFLAVSYENDCEYCMSGHSVLAAAAKVPAQAIQALRDGGTIADARLQALRSFAQAVVRSRGKVTAAETEAFIDAGFTRQQVLEVLVVVATKVISNYTNHIAGTPLDAFMARTAWQHPSHRRQAA
jgi:uncharacterized peroxidase-related enzyme